MSANITDPKCKIIQHYELSIIMKYINAVIIKKDIITPFHTLNNSNIIIDI